MVIGTSLKVEPVASIIERVPYKVPKILINKDPIPNRGFNLQLLGLCDDVVSYLCKCLKWDIPHADFNNNDEFKLSKLKMVIGKLSRNQLRQKMIKLILVSLMFFFFNSFYIYIYIYLYFEIIEWFCIYLPTIVCIVNFYQI